METVVNVGAGQNAWLAYMRRVTAIPFAFTYIRLCKYSWMTGTWSWLRMMRGTVLGRWTDDGLGQSSNNETVYSSTPPHNFCAALRLCAALGVHEWDVTNQARWDEVVLTKRWCIPRNLNSGAQGGGCAAPNFGSTEMECKTDVRLTPSQNVNAELGWWSHSWRWTVILQKALQAVHHCLMIANVVSASCSLLYHNTLLEKRLSSGVGVEKHAR